MSPVSANARWTTSRGRDARRPRRIVALKSGRRRSRDAAGSTGIAIPGGVRPTGPDGPFGGEQRGSLDPHECACAAGSHGSLRGGDCSAGTCACSLEGSRKETVRRVIGVIGVKKGAGCRRVTRGSMRNPKAALGTSGSQGPPTVRADRRDGQTWSGPRNRLAVTCDHRLSPPSPGVTCPQRLGSLPSQVICRSGLLVVENSLKHRVARC